MSMFGLSGAALSPYLYMNAGLTGRSTYGGALGLSGLTGQNSWRGLSGLSNQTGSLSFASVLEKALDVLPACGCECCAVKTEKGDAESAKKNASFLDSYADYARQSREQYRSSLKQSLIKSGKIKARDYLV